MTGTSYPRNAMSTTDGCERRYSTVGRREPIWRCNNARNTCTMSLRVYSESTRTHLKLHARHHREHARYELLLVHLLRQLSHLLRHRVTVLMSDAHTHLLLHTARAWPAAVSAKAPHGSGLESITYFAAAVATERHIRYMPAPVCRRIRTKPHT